MANYIFSAKASTSGVTLNMVDVSSNGYGLASSLLYAITANNLTTTPQYITVSAPTTATGTNFASVGQVSNGDFGITGTAWRMSNGTGNNLTARVSATGFGLIIPFPQSYDFFAGTDTYIISPRLADHSLTISGQQPMNATATNDVFSNVVNNEEASLTNADTYTLIGSSYNDTLVGNGSNDTLLGGNGHDVLEGLGGDDSLDGGISNDQIDGGVGSDTILGGTGTDTLLGGAGNDQLVGGSQADTLTGGTGSDKFVLNQTATADTVTDFSVGQADVFWLARGVYQGVSAGALTVITPPPTPGGGAANNIIVGTTAQINGFNSASAVRFAYNTSSNQLFYDADGNFSGGSILIANVNPTVFADGNNTSFVVI